MQHRKPGCFIFETFDCILKSNEGFKASSIRVWEYVLATRINIVATGDEWAVSFAARSRSIICQHLWKHAMLNNFPWIYLPPTRSFHASSKR
jgi:hypothetical protein